jgi:predicted histidine transporter YuiF (NhaC family)
MSLALIKMWFALGAIAAMFISVIFILLSRHKVKNKFLKGIMAFIAYTLMIASGFIIFIVVFSGPVSE